MHAIFVLNSLEFKAMYEGMLVKYTRGGTLKGMCAIFVLISLESKSLFKSMLEKYTTGGTIKDNRRRKLLTTDDGKRVSWVRA